MIKLTALEIIDALKIKYGGFENWQNRLEIVEKELKTLEIVKEKKVNVGNFIYWLKRKPRTYKDYLQDYCQEQWYLHYKDNNDDRCKFYKLTEEEYELLKEVLL